MKKLFSFSFFFSFLVTFWEPNITFVYDNFVFYYKFVKGLGPLYFCYEFVTFCTSNIFV